MPASMSQTVRTNPIWKWHPSTAPASNGTGITLSATPKTRSPATAWRIQFGLGLPQVPCFSQDESYSTSWVYPNPPDLAGCRFPEVLELAQVGQLFPSPIHIKQLSFIIFLLWRESCWLIWTSCHWRGIL